MHIENTLRSVGTSTTMMRKVISALNELDSSKLCIIGSTSARG